MEAVNSGDKGLHPSCPEDGVFHHFWRDPPRHSSISGSGSGSGAAGTFSLSAQLEPKPYPPDCPVVQLVLWASMPQTVQGRLLSHLAGTKGVRVLEVRQVRWPRGRWNWQGSSIHERDHPSTHSLARVFARRVSEFKRRLGFN